LATSSHIFVWATRSGSIGLTFFHDTILAFWFRAKAAKTRDVKNRMLTATKGGLGTIIAGNIVGNLWVLIAIPQRMLMKKTRHPRFTTVMRLSFEMLGT